MDYEQLLQMISDPQMADALAQMSAYGDKSAILGNQMGLGHERAEAPLPTGMKAGGTYVAGNPLEFLAAGLQRARGEQGMQAAQAGQQGLIQGDVNTRKRLGGAMYQAMQRSRMPTATSAPDYSQPDTIGINPNIT